MPVLTNAERMVLISALRGEPVSVRFSEQVTTLQDMEFVLSCRQNCAVTWNVRLSSVGHRLARAYVDTHFGELWSQLGIRLAVRAEYATDPRRVEILLARSRVAMRRGMDAGVRGFAVIGGV